MFKSISFFFLFGKFKVSFVRFDFQVNNVEKHIFELFGWLCFMCVKQFTDFFHASQRVTYQFKLKHKVFLNKQVSFCLTNAGAQCRKCRTFTAICYNFFASFVFRLFNLDIFSDGVNEVFAFSFLLYELKAIKTMSV